MHAVRYGILTMSCCVVWLVHNVLVLRLCHRPVSVYNMLWYPWCGTSCTATCKTCKTCHQICHMYHARGSRSHGRQRHTSCMVQLDEMGVVRSIDAPGWSICIWPQAGSVDCSMVNVCASDSDPPRRCPVGRSTECWSIPRQLLASNSSTSFSPPKIQQAVKPLIPDPMIAIRRRRIAICTFAEESVVTNP